ncbi:ATP-dependent Clp protease ATP-binding subunit [Pendulispora brunnea]|uniref:ATP-dependent Clp protease ATP-binding subunit n=2 Tax=Pendulispora brunnea TaxID=2905690 RepID=A0ABZ2KNN0_9BACT
MARRIAAGEHVTSLDDRILVAIDPPVLLAGTGMRGQLAERMQQLLAEVKKSEGRIVLVFEEIHALFGADGGDEGISELKAALASGQVRCIGTSSPKEYRRVIESDGALARRFSVVEVEEPGDDEALAIMENVIPLFEGHHHARYAKEALAASLRWSVRYLPGRALPDKSISVLDLAGARSRRRKLAEVGPEQVAEVVAELAGVPVERLLETDSERMLRFEALLAQRIVGHTDALARIAAVLRRNASGFRTRRPIGSFLLLGPTGVGKTETAKAIAELLFHSENAMTRLDLSEYAEPHAVSRLVGAPPGYVGHEAGGFLTEAVRRRPYQVVLLDEIEKAHRDVLEAFLQVFDDGRLTDGRGRTVDFTNTVILLTSNIGADVARPRPSTRRIGFSPADAAARDDADRREATAYSDAIVAAARSALPPELYNRLDEVMAFAPLTRTDVAEVARRMLAALGAELERTRGIRLDASEDAIAALLDAGGFDPEMGARPMRRTIARLVEAPIAEMLLRQEVRRGDIATVDVEDGAIIVDAVTPS